MRSNSPASARTSPGNPSQRTGGPQTLAALLADRRAMPNGDGANTSPRTSDHRPEQECITADELASWMGVNRKTVYEYAARNVIPCRRLGRRLVFSLPAIKAWLARSAGSDPVPSVPMSSRRR